MRLIRAGAWNAYLPVLLPGRLAFGRGRAALVTERDQVSVRMAAEAARLANRFPRTLGSAQNVPARYRCEGLAVRIAVGAPADHAGSRVIRVWGPATEHDVSASDEPGHPAGLYVRRCVRSQKES